jgi:2-phosphosulfolactate phosphatase
VDIAVSRGATVYPYRWRDQRAHDYATSLNAVLAEHDRGAGFSLSPASLLTIPATTRLVLPSPNGATLSFATGTTPTLAGCFRNAEAVAHAARRLGRRIGVVPAGERWPDGSLRPAIEDWLGAGAIIHHLAGTRSAEALLAEQAFLQAAHDLPTFLKGCLSGQELIERGFTQDVALAAALNSSGAAPLLQDGTYRDVG